MVSLYIILIERKCLGFLEGNDKYNSYIIKPIIFSYITYVFLKVMIAMSKHLDVEQGVSFKSGVYIGLLREMYWFSDLQL